MLAHHMPFIQLGEHNKTNKIPSIEYADRTKQNKKRVFLVDNILI